MNIKELLKTRFELIADYPGNSQQIGNVTIEDATASYFRKFPANFQELEWWQKRTNDDMPGYLKVGINGKVRKVKQYIWWTDRTCNIEFEGGRCRKLNRQWTPCEEAEYLSTLAQLDTVNK